MEEKYYSSLLYLARAGVKKIEGVNLGKCKWGVVISERERIESAHDESKVLKYLPTKEYASYVYVLLDTKNNVCKIGTSKTPLLRFKTIKSGNPFVKIFAIVYGSHKVERMLHFKYRQYNIEGEWFNYEGDLKESLNSDSFQKTNLYCAKQNKIINGHGD